MGSKTKREKKMKGERTKEEVRSEGLIGQIEAWFEAK